MRGKIIFLLGVEARWVYLGRKGKSWEMPSNRGNRLLLCLSSVKKRNAELADNAFVPALSRVNALISDFNTCSFILRLSF